MLRIRTGQCQTKCGADQYYEENRVSGNLQIEVKEFMERHRAQTAKQCSEQGPASMRDAKTCRNQNQSGINDEAEDDDGSDCTCFSQYLQIVVVRLAEHHG